jgi:hypothetical protein
VTISEQTNRTWDQLNQRAMELALTFSIYADVFGVSTDRIEAFNKFDGHIAWFLQKLLYEKLIADICKLLDRAQTTGRDNLSLAQLLNAIEEDEGEDAQARAILEAVRKSAEKFFEIRNKRISHHDLLYQMGKATIDEASRRDIKKSLDEIFSFLNYLSEKHRGIPIHYDMIQHSFSADRLERLMKVAVDWENENF